MCVLRDLLVCKFYANFHCAEIYHNFRQRQDEDFQVSTVRESGLLKQNAVAEATAFLAALELQVRS
jgi:hypothetical protein